MTDQVQNQCCVDYDKARAEQGKPARKVKKLEDILEYLEPPKPSGELRATRITDEEYVRTHSVSLAKWLEDHRDCKSPLDCTPSIFWPAD